MPRGAIQTEFRGAVENFPRPPDFWDVVLYTNSQGGQLNPPDKYSPVRQYLGGRSAPGSRCDNHGTTILLLRNAGCSAGHQAAPCNIHPRGWLRAFRLCVDAQSTTKTPSWPIPLAIGGKSFPVTQVETMDSLGGLGEALRQPDDDHLGRT